MHHILWDYRAFRIKNLNLQSNQFADVLNIWTMQVARFAGQVWLLSEKKRNKETKNLNKQWQFM